MTESTTQTTETKPTDTTTSTNTPAPTPEWKMTLPEGVTLAKDFLGGYEEVAKKSGLKPEVAAGVAAYVAKYQSDAVPKAAAELMAAARKKDSETWRAASEKEFQGEKLKSLEVAASRALEKYGTPELRSFLKEHEIGNHPELVRFIFKVGESLKEDSVAGTSATGRSDSKEEQLKRMYPNSPRMFASK